MAARSAASLWAYFVLVSGSTDDRWGSRGDFLHGVASGEPRADGIVLWTRVTPQEPKALSLDVAWEVWENSSQASKARWSGEVVAQGERDYTVKIDVVGGAFRPGVWYTYRFRCGKSLSPSGHFRLPPAAGERLDELTYAIFSCANWEKGLFSAYSAAAASRPLDFWVHLGDWYYEYERGHYKHAPAPPRPALEPPHEIVSLEDYRLRHAQYRTDADLQRLAAAAPLIAIWDDHEFANDAWMHGALNHQPDTEGDFEVRKGNAIRAYHEWMPTRPHATSVALGASSGPARSEAAWAPWRRFDFGDLAAMLLLEARVTARTTTEGELRWATVNEKVKHILSRAGDPSPDAWNSSSLQDEMLALRDEVDLYRENESKAILGDEQLNWLSEQLEGAGPLWRLIGQPLVVQKLVAPDFEAAVLEAHRNGEPFAEMWAQVLANLTKVGASYTCGDETVNVTAEMRGQLLATLAYSRFGIRYQFDGWSGYLAERERLAQLIRKARGGVGDVVVYGGDSHNAWAGLIYTQDGEAAAPDFDGMSVSSTGLEQWGLMSPEFQLAAWHAANPTLVWADIHNRGFMLARLNRTHHHLEYRGVNTTISSHTSRCLAAFEVARGVALEEPGALRSAGCLTVVGGPLQLGSSGGTDGSVDADGGVLAGGLAAAGASSVAGGLLLACLVFKVLRFQGGRGHKRLDEDRSYSAAPLVETREPYA